MKQRNNIQILCLIILFCLLIINVGCTRRETHENFIKTENGKYLFAFSTGLREESINSFSVLYQDGTVNEHPVNRSIVIVNSLRIGEALMFFSRQKNTHFVIENNRLQEFSFLEERYGDSYVGVLFASENNGYILTGMNVGFSDEGYISELLYKEESEGGYHNITFYDKILCSAVYSGGIIYLQYLDLNKRDDNDFFRKSGILEIDVYSQEIISDILLDSKYEGEPDRPLVLSNNEVILFRPELNEEAILTGRSHLAVYSQGEIKKELTLEDFIVIHIHAFNGKLYLVDLFGSVRVLDDEYKLLDIYELDQFQGSIRDLYTDEGELYVALMDEKKLMKINRYNLGNGRLMESDPIIYPKTIDWNKESFTFLPIK